MPITSEISCLGKSCLTRKCGRASIEISGQQNITSIPPPSLPYRTSSLSQRSFSANEYSIEPPDQYWAMTGFAERFNTVKCLKSSLLTLKTLPKPGDCPSLPRTHSLFRRRQTPDHPINRY